MLKPKSLIPNYVVVWLLVIVRLLAMVWRLAIAYWGWWIVSLGWRVWGVDTPLGGWWNDT